MHAISWIQKTAVSLYAIVLFAPTNVDAYEPDPCASVVDRITWLSHSIEALRSQSGRELSGADLRRLSSITGPEKDPWGRDWVLGRDGKTVFSAGRNGISGDSDDIVVGATCPYRSVTFHSDGTSRWVMDQDEATGKASAARLPKFTRAALVAIMLVLGVSFAIVRLDNAY